MAVVVVVVARMLLSEGDRKGERHERASGMLELGLSTWAGIIGMSLEIKLSVLVVTTSWRVLELVWRWTDPADVLGGCRTIEARPLVGGERKGVDRLYVGKKVCKGVTLVAIEDGGGGGGVAHC